MTEDTGIHTKAMQVNLTISTWTAKKLDKVVTAEVHARNNAERDAGLYTKRLLGKNAEAYNDLMKIARKARTEHYELTLPWDNDGTRLLPTKQFTTYTDWLRNTRSAFTSSLNDFCEDYYTLRDRSKMVLGKMYRAEDYPDVENVRSRFNVDASFSPLPLRGDLRVDLPREQVERIETDVEERIRRATEEAVRDCWNRLYERVKHVKERLSDPENIFRDSLIDNVTEVCEILTRLNVTGDPELEAMRQRVEQELATRAPIDLRTNPSIRAETARKAGDILSDMKAIYGGA